MLCFAFAVMAGTITARLHPECISLFTYGCLLVLLLAFWFVVTPKKVAAFPEPADGLSAGYRKYIVPEPGFFAKRGLNRFVLVTSSIFFLVGVWRQDVWRERLSPERLPGKNWFDATLLALAPAREYADEKGPWRVSAALLTADGEQVDDVPVSLSGPAGQFFRRGDIIHARVRRQGGFPKIHPGAFDARLWLERDGLAASLAVAPPRRDGTRERPPYVVTAMAAAPVTTWVRRSIDAVRATAIRATLEYGGESGGMLAAMLYGYRKEVSTDLRDTFRRTGIGHVLAISGLHVGLVIGLLWWLSGWAGCPSRWRAAACLALAFVYLGLSGGQVAAARATVMAVIHLGGIAAGRKSDMMNSLGTAAFFLTLFNPSAPVDVSFQLSFTAVAFIHLALADGPARKTRPSGPAFGRAASWRQRLARETVSLVRLSVFTWIGLFPIVALVFNQVNLVGLPINIAIIPFMSLVLAGGLLLPCVGWISGLGWLAELPSRLLAWIAQWSDSLPASSFPVHAPTTCWVFLFYFFVFLLSLRGIATGQTLRRWWRQGCLLGVFLALAGMVWGMASQPPPASGRLAVLPGRGMGMGMVVAEAPDGSIALVGTFARGGLNEAGWLHFMRRRGGAAVVALGDGGEDENLSALSYHYSIVSSLIVPTIDKDADLSPQWREIAGAPGIRYALSRDSRGRIVWLAVRAGHESVCLAPRLAERQFTWRLERRTPGFDADLLCVGFSGRDAELPASPAPRGKVGLLGRHGGDLPDGWFERRRFGALVVENGVRGFDGEKWVEL